MIYPHPKGAKSSVNGGIVKGIHETAGDDGFAPNMALDFMAAGGTPVLASEDGVIEEISGHNPNLGEVEPGIFGWNVYLKTATGFRYFDTHLGDYTVHVGQHVKAGKIIGHVGHWPHDPARSHTHRGVTSPNHSRSAATTRVRKVALGPRVKGHA